MTLQADPRFWDAIAEDYAKRPFPNPEATARKLALVKELLRPTDQLLDVGCGRPSRSSSLRTSRRPTGST